MNSPPYLKHFPRRLALEFLLYALLTAFALHATWLTWPDAVIDFSRELYLPWRVSCGDVLYRDLAYYFGPVSVYTNAILFVLLGHASIHALFALNFAFWLATLLALRALLRRITSPLAATLAVSSFILLFSFNRYTDIGNDNFLAPYSHEITRGFLFALLALLSLDSAFRRFPDGPPQARASARFLLPGFFCALVLFSKPELALAATAALAVLFALYACRRRAIPLRPLFAFALAVLSTIVFVVAPFAIAFRSVPRAFHETFLKLYLDCLRPALTSLPYFKSVLGMDAPLANSLRLLRGVVLAGIPFLFARLALPRLSSRPLRICVTVLLSALAAAIAWKAWPDLNAALPAAPLVLLGVILLHGRRGTPAPSGIPENPAAGIPPLAIAFALFAFALTSKIILNAGVFHYGFVLALPAFCCAVLLLSLPPCSSHRFVVVVALLVGFSVSALLIQSSVFRRWDVSHGIHDDSFLASPLDSRAFEAALDWIRSHTPPDSTLAVLPEGAILNVLSGRPNPTPYVSLPITDWLRYDEPSLLAAWSNHPPDTLVLVQTTQNRFGIDYANSLFSLLDSLYEPALTITVPSPSGPRPYLLVATRIASP